METETKTAGQAATSALKGLAGTQSTTTQRQQPPDRNWLDTHLKLQTKGNPKLVELEREVWWFCHDMVKSLLKVGSSTGGRLLLIHGENGTGKTHCAKKVYRWAVRANVQYIESGHLHNLSARSRFASWPELLDTLKSGGWDVVEDLNQCALLVLDELGGAHDPSGVGTDKLCQILSRREFKWTILTTNVVPAAWEEKFDRRISSRFFRNSVIVDLTGVQDFSIAP